MNNNICGHMITNEDVQTSIMKNTQIGGKNYCVLYLAVLLTNGKTI